MSLSGNSHFPPWNTKPLCAPITHPVHFPPSSFCFIDLPVEMQSFLNPVTAAPQAFHTIPGCKNEQPSLGAPWQSDFVEDHPQDMLKTQTRTKKRRARSFCNSCLAPGPGCVTCNPSPMPCWAAAISCRESIAGARGPRAVQVWKQWHWEFCGVHCTINSPFASLPPQSCVGKDPASKCWTLMLKKEIKDWFQIKCFNLPV